MTEHSDVPVADLLKRFAPRRPERFRALLPHRELILELRRMSASYLTIYHVLEFKGIQTSETTVSSFCKTMLHQEPKSTSRKTPKETKRPPAPFSSPPPQSTGPRIASVEFVEKPKI